jgi:O-6-methylguanine DNA methyltransferase
MSINRNDNIFRYIADFSDLFLELISDSNQLLKLDFIQHVKKIKNSEIISDPIKHTLSFLDDYFSGKKCKITIHLNTDGSSSLVKHSEKLILNMTGYTGKEILIYRELLNVGPGKKISYGELASRSGIPRGARFAGNCMAGNRFPILIPCHRVIKGDGSMGNYSGGVGIKEFLLKHEMEKFQ